VLPLPGTSLGKSAPSSSAVYSWPPPSFTATDVPMKRATTPVPDHANLGPAGSLESTRPTKRTAGGIGRVHGRVPRVDQPPIFGERFGAAIAAFAGPVAYDPCARGQAQNR
jgi:hypothetical protein